MLKNKQGNIFIIKIKIFQKISKNAYIEIIQKPKHISILIKSRISNSQKDNWLDFTDLTNFMFVGFFVIWIFKKLRKISAVDNKQLTGK